ncbi:MAG: cytidylate kinase-like family protein [Clostridiales bacterium]|nr:cytidylate kinase-like family protein [Clostridiales bacterium]
MSEQLIISVSREYASGGHVVAEKLAKIFGLPLYDYNLLKEIAAQKGINVSKLEKYDELPKNKLLSRKVRGYSNSPQENIANMQFEYLKSKAEQGESFVVVGRCAETILKEYDCLIPIFIMADMDYKLERVMTTEGLTKEDAQVQIKRQNWKRKEYHNYFCSEKWGDSRNYDVCINCSKLGLDGTTKMLEQYIRERLSIREKGIGDQDETKEI